MLMNGQYMRNCLIACVRGCACVRQMNGSAMYQSDCDSDLLSTRGGEVIGTGGRVEW